MPILPNPKHEAFAQALARGLSISAAYVQAGYKANRGNAHKLKQNQDISKRVEEIQAEQLAIHQQVTAEAAANAKVTIEGLIQEAEAARAKAMDEKGSAAAAVSALIAKAKLAGMWREKIDQHNTGGGTTVQFAANVLPIIRHIQAAGHTSLNAVAGQLNARKVATANGGRWRHVRGGSSACTGRVIAGRPSTVVLHHLDEHRGCSTG